MDLHQKTLAQPIVIMGKGLHSGRIIRMEILPAQAGNGIAFERVDSGTRPVTATIDNVSSTDLSTTIGSGQQTVATIEHLMAAFHGLGIDNALIRLNGPEVPIMDGSAEPFVKRLGEAGIVTLSAYRKFFLVDRPFELRAGDSFLRVTPAPRFSARCTINFPRPVIGRQMMDFENTQADFGYMSSARTFCHIDDVQEMRRRGLALGGSLQNAVVISDTGVLNEGGLRGENEFVRHKLLDLFGDMFLLDGFLLAHVVAHKPGHWLHVEFLRRFLADPSACQVVSGMHFAEARESVSVQSFDFPAMASFA